jgi:hypothetical protein
MSQENVEIVRATMEAGIEVSRGKYAQVGSYRDGLLVHWRFYGDQAEALEAVGLSE